jgi:4-hydroxy-tetrahydrodipicolinate reductase
MLRVAVAGALGRMGRVACNALQHANGVEYAGGLARTPLPEEHVVTDFDALLLDGKPDVLLDLTTYPQSVQISTNALVHGVRPVIGASGWTTPDCEALDAVARKRGLGAMLVPNFSIGAILMMRFAEEAAKYFPSVEIIELHHDRKQDAPSGTAKRTAQRIAKGGGPANVPIHSVRMRGLLAHHEVLFGTDGELLTIRHDSFSRESFVPGMLAAVHAVMTVNGLKVGLDA